MTHRIKDKFAAMLLEYPKPTGLHMAYGTAGFRARTDTLPWVMIRVGILAAFRSKVKQGDFISMFICFTKRKSR